jgi:transcriptional regulator with XRE-family HTH domain
MNTKPSTSTGSIRRRAKDIDRYVGARVRARRVMLGLTQRQLAELIGVTVQQVCKYEGGSNRVASGHLYQLAQALGVGVGYFFEGMGRDDTLEVTPQQRRFLALARSFNAIPNRSHQQGIISLARALADPDPVAVRDSRRRIVWPA